MLEKKEPLNLTGRVAVVTGGSSGIGLGVVEILSAYGAKVAMVDISPKGEEKAQELRAAGRDVTFFQCDVTSEEQVKKTVDDVVTKYGPINILHNNAGVTVRKTIDNLTEKEWDFVLDVGLKGMFLFSKHVIPVMEHYQYRLGLGTQGRRSGGCLLCGEGRYRQCHEGDGD